MRFTPGSVELSDEREDPLDLCVVRHGAVAREDSLDVIRVRGQDIRDAVRVVLVEAAAHFHQALRELIGALRVHLREVLRVFEREVLLVGQLGARALLAFEDFLDLGEGDEPDWHRGGLVSLLESHPAHSFVGAAVMKRRCSGREMMVFCLFFE